MQAYNTVANSSVFSLIQIMWLPRQQGRGAVECCFRLCRLSHSDTCDVVTSFYSNGSDRSCHLAGQIIPSYSPGGDSRHFLSTTWFLGPAQLVFLLQTASRSVYPFFFRTHCCVNRRTDIFSSSPQLTFICSVFINIVFVTFNPRAVDIVNNVAVSTSYVTQPYLLIR